MAPVTDEELGPPLNYNEENDTEYPADADDMGRMEPLLKLHGTQEHPRMFSSWRDMFGEGDSHTSKVAAGIVVGAVNAMVATLFYFLLEGSLFTVWEFIPEHIWAPLVGDHFWLRHAYTVLVPTVLGFGVGLSLLYVGYPGDLPFMVYCVHHGGQIPLKHFIPMLVCASVSITGGGSLGPEAPIVLMCGCVGGLVGQWLGHKGKMMRTTTLMGMACGFAAFFGAPLGGSMFALEVLHRVGMEYFESATYAVLAGTLCCIMYHSLTGMAMGNIWNFPTDLGQPSVHHLLVGVALGFVGAFTSFVFLKVHKVLGHVFESLRLKKHQLVMSTVAGCLLGVLGLLVPHSFFWGEFEVQSIIDRGGGLLPHIWPKDQVIVYDLGKPGPNLMVALAKMAAVSITIHGGFRGGFIFPFFLTGSAVGQAIHLAIPSLHPVVCMMGVASALDVAITRTPWASALILACLSGQPNVLQPAVTAALTSLVLTYSSKFQLIKTQQTRRFSEPEPEDEWPPYDPTRGE